MYTYLTIDPHDHCTIDDLAVWVASTNLGNVKSVRMSSDFQGKTMAVVLTWMYGEEWSDGDTAWTLAQDWAKTFSAAVGIEITYSEPAIWNLI